MSTVNLSLSDAEKEELIQYYESELKKINARKHTIENLLSKLKSNLAEEEIQEVHHYVNKNGVTVEKSEHISSGLFNESDLGEYNLEWTWSEKIRFIITRENKCLKTFTVAQKLFEIEGENIPEEQREVAARSISATLSRKSQKGKTFLRYTPYDGADFFYGLKEWFISDGEVKEEYKA